MVVQRYSSIVALAIISNAAMAASYQGEVSGSYHDLDEDKAYELSATAYFEPVSSEGHPLQEAAFLQRNSSAGLTFTRFGAEPDEENHGSINLDYYVPDSMFYIGGQYTWIDEAENEFESDDRDDAWGVTLGITPAEGLLLSTSYRVIPVYAGSLIGRLIGSGILFDRDSYDTNLNVKYVTELANGKAANFEGGFVQYDSADLFFLGGDYYFDSTFSVGAWIEDLGSLSTDKGYGIRTEKFFTESASLQGSYFSRGDTNMWEVGVRVRF